MENNLIPSPPGWTAVGDETGEPTGHVVAWSVNEDGYLIPWVVWGKDSCAVEMVQDKGFTYVLPPGP